MDQQSIVSDVEMHASDLHDAMKRELTPHGVTDVEITGSIQGTLKVTFRGDVAVDISDIVAAAVRKLNPTCSVIAKWKHTDESRSPPPPLAASTPNVSGGTAGNDPQRQPATSSKPAHAQPKPAVASGSQHGAAATAEPAAALSESSANAAKNGGTKHLGVTTAKPAARPPRRSAHHWSSAQPSGTTPALRAQTADRNSPTAVTLIQPAGDWPVSPSTSRTPSRLPSRSTSPASRAESPGPAVHGSQPATTPPRMTAGGDDFTPASASAATVAGSPSGAASTPEVRAAAHAPPHASFCRARTATLPERTTTDAAKPRRSTPPAKRHVPVTAPAAGTGGSHRASRPHAPVAFNDMLTTRPDVVDAVRHGHFREPALLIAAIKALTNYPYDREEAAKACSAILPECALRAALTPESTTFAGRLVAPIAEVRDKWTKPTTMAHGDMAFLCAKVILTAAAPKKASWVNTWSDAEVAAVIAAPLALLPRNEATTP